MLQGRPRVHARAGDRRGAAASLYAAARSLFEQFCTCFNDADAVIVAHVYAAGEAPIAGVDRDHLVAGVRARGHRQVDAARRPRATRRHRARLGAARATIVVCLGAGIITQWAYALPGELAACGRVSW